MRKGVARPSLRLRAAIAVGLLLGFYFVTVTIALVLLALGGVVIFAMAAQKASISYGAFVIIAATAMPACLLLWGLVKARPPRFEPSGRELLREEAPALFAMLDELSVATKTRGPSRVYLAPDANVGVTQRGGLLGIGSVRVLVLGVPMLHLLRTSQMRAVLAHELGHFVGSDTQLAGIASYTHALFVSVLRSTTTQPAFAREWWPLALGAQVSAWLGGSIARFYARVYFRITRALGRRQELAADAISAEIAGTDTTISALESAMDAHLYDAYLTTDVLEAVSGGAMPSDLLEGFDAFRAAFLAREDGKEALARLRAEATDPFDSHPSLGDRVASLKEDVRVVPPRSGDDAPAMSLLAIEAAKWLPQGTMKMYTRPVDAWPLQTMPWSEVPAKAFEPSVRDQANQIARALTTMFPQAQTLPAMFAALVAALEAGAIAHVAWALEPDIGRLPYHQQSAFAQQLAMRALAALFQGALLDKGARATPSLGAPCLVWRYLEEDVTANVLVARSFEAAAEREAIRGWAARLAS